MDYIKPATDAVEPIPVIAPDPEPTASASFSDKAGEKAREYAGLGKDKASETLSEISSVIDGIADTVAEKLGPQYGNYARQAATLVAGTADSLKNAEIDDIVEGTRKFVRDKPAIAIGAAAVAGFLLTRMLRAGSDNRDND